MNIFLNIFLFIMGLVFLVFLISSPFIILYLFLTYTRKYPKEHLKGVEDRKRFIRKQREQNNTKIDLDNI